MYVVMQQPLAAVVIITATEEEVRQSSMKRKNVGVGKGRSS